MYWPPNTPIAEIDAAVEVLRKTVDANDIYALIGGIYKRDENEKPFERLLVIDPDGKILQTYNKMWQIRGSTIARGFFRSTACRARRPSAPTAGFASVEELPAVAGAKILFECSNNYADEWLPDLGWFWYVPRAMRNEAFVVFANTAKRGPGREHAGTRAQRLHWAGRDDSGGGGRGVGQAAGRRARPIASDRRTGAARRSHPALKSFWEMGVSMLAGKTAAATAHQPLNSPQVEIKIAAAQMACSRKIEDNVARIEKLVREAKAGGADVVVFPELAVTGARDEDIFAATSQQLAGALAQDSASRQAVTDSCRLRAAVAGGTASGRTARSPSARTASC